MNKVIKDSDKDNWTTFEVDCTDECIKLPSEGLGDPLREV